MTAPAPTLVRLAYHPRAWQQQVHAAFRDGRRFVVAACHRRAGKTKAGTMQLVDAALQATQEAALFVYLAPFRTQAKAIAWSELRRTVAPLGPGAVTISESDLAVTFRHNGARVQLAGADNADALRGLRLDGAVLDEFAHFAPDAWHDVLHPALADRQGWALFIGTPAGLDAFSELFFAAPSREGWAALRFTVDDTGDALPADEVARLRREMPEQAFAREFLCDFSASGDNQLISLADVDAAARRGYPEHETHLAPKILGVDPARFGADRSGIVQRQGLQMLAPIVLRGVDNMQLASRVANVIAEWRPDAVFIDSGAGAGVIDRLRQLGYTVNEVPFGGRALKPEFANRRTEMWCAMAAWLRNGGAIPNDLALKQELATPTYEFDAQNRRVLESKDDIKKRLLGASSPDIADALALTFAAPVQNRRDVEARAHRHRDERPYDPRDGMDSWRTWRHGHDLRETADGGIYSPTWRRT